MDYLYKEAIRIDDNEPYNFQQKKIKLPQKSVLKFQYNDFCVEKKFLKKKYYLVYNGVVAFCVNVDHVLNQMSVENIINEFEQHGGVNRLVAYEKWVKDIDATDPFSIEN